jgi:hypothetical protein
METPTKPLRGAELLQALRERKARIREEAIEEYWTNPEVRATVEKLKQVNGRKKESQLNAMSFPT